jgi:Cytochrome C oxidase, cbb3-type, subunit III
MCWGPCCARLRMRLKCARSRLLAQGAGMGFTSGFGGALAFVLMAGVVAPALAQDIDAGKRLYKRADCATCHGWAGDGGEGRVDMNPKIPSIRTSKMDQLQLFDTIRCSKPFGEMPFYERLAYTDERCYGFRAVDVPGVVPPLSNNWLTRQEMTLLVDYLQNKAIGRGAPTFEECEEYFAPGAAQCQTYPKRAN